MIKHGYAVLPSGMFIEEEPHKGFVDNVIEVYGQRNIADAWNDRPDSDEHNICPWSGIYYLVNIRFDASHEDVRIGGARFKGDIIPVEAVEFVQLLTEV